VFPLAFFLLLPYGVYNVLCATSARYGVPPRFNSWYMVARCTPTASAIATTLSPACIMLSMRCLSWKFNRFPPFFMLFSPFFSLQTKRVPQENYSLATLFDFYIFQ
jgi:hypothetical protein